ncbi:MOSC domain-containing protein [Auraticoccus monumenti]|uniref:MOSC domain-containing protein n=1 Tax=Auraticoccus monumenti TaxID=675864 RepID=A0A1G6YD33_9ACTN|nr:MOSC N-terminal beta barrel domain-containing protein [Auraticoccus monumenti]SDD88181.1 hypothetical protein SAMN04489747_1968 [Auraticoccus monumenti]
MQLLSLSVHPVKSTAARPVPQARLERAGLVGDRRWMVLDGDGAMLTARTEPRLLRLTADVAGTAPGVSGLRLRAEGIADLHLPEPGGPEQEVRVFSDRAVAVDAGEEAATWLRAALGRDDVRLVHTPRPQARPLDPRYAGDGDHTGFADGFPVLLTTTASLAALDDLVATEAVERALTPPEPLSMTRFRPNLVVEGAEPFAEHGWSRLRVGAAVLRVVKPCARCVMTTVDPLTLERGPEPLRTLARHRRVDGRPVFGVNLVPDTTGDLAVGDPVEVLA